MRRIPPFAALVVVATLSTVPTQATAAARASHDVDHAIQHQLNDVVTTSQAISRQRRTADRMVRQINAVRARGANCGGKAYAPVGPVIRVPLLDRVSQNYATQMAQENFFGHVSPDGIDPITRAKAAGYRDQVAEIIAAGQTTAASAVAAWRDSAEHCAILMSGRKIGVGYAGNPGSDYVHYWTMNAHRPG